SRLKEAFGGRDLFAFDAPLQSDTYFFGRTQEIQNLYSKYKLGEHGGLFGLRKIGKTSVLYAVKRYLELRDEPAVFLDCSEPSLHRRRWNEALYFLVSTLTRSLKIAGKVKASEEAMYNEKDASYFFEEDLTRIYNFIGRKRLLFILDEVESI